MNNENHDSQRTADSRTRSGSVPSGSWVKPAIIALVFAAIVMAALLWPQVQELRSAKQGATAGSANTEQRVGNIRSLLDQVDHAGAERQIHEFRLAHPDYDLDAALFSSNTVQ
ncbi:MAG: hypothetical protein V3V12_03110 [Gammaproteobacteria bacterium]